MRCVPFDLSLSIRIAFGPGRIAGLSADLDQLVGHKASLLLIADPGVAAAGLVEQVTSALQGGGHQLSTCTEFGGEPKAVQIDAAAAAARRCQADGIIALGGGSVLDLAKLAAAVAVAGAPAEAYALMRTPLPARPLPVIALPTTAGTGAEVTRTAVFTDRAGHKVWAWGDALRPALALLDPDLTLGLPPALTALTGADALVHAIEAATSRRSHPVAASQALHAIRLIMAHLPQAVADGGHAPSRAALLVAATLAGLAIDGAGTGIAHALGHALGSLAPVPHGRAVALALRSSLAWNAAAAPEAFAPVALAMGVAPEPAALAEALAGLLATIGISPDLADVGIGPADAPRLVELCQAPENQPMLAANARQAEPADLAALAAALCAGRCRPIPATEQPA